MSRVISQNWIKTARYRNVWAVVNHDIEVGDEILVYREKPKTKRVEHAYYYPSEHSKAQTYYKWELVLIGMFSILPKHHFYLYTTVIMYVR